MATTPADGNFRRRVDGDAITYLLTFGGGSEWQLPCSMLQRGVGSSPARRQRRVMSGGASLEEEVTATLLIELSKRQLAIFIE